jgi:hypothetical protein
MVIKQEVTGRRPHVIQFTHKHDGRESSDGILRREGGRRKKTDLKKKKWKS